MSELIGKSIGRYHILEQLGQGGMATVYKAFDTRLEREVAIKIIRKEAFPSEVHERMLKRFEREAKALAKLQHPNIVKVYDYGEFEGAPYLIMELLSGGTLKEYAGSAMVTEDAARLLSPIARALSYAHENGILHRDVKPSNILITAAGDPILTDFGIAKLLEGDQEYTLTGTNVGVGTPEYMAPEQGLGKNVDGRADIYALGIVFYELVTGRKPFVADTPLAVLYKQMNDPLQLPKDLGIVVSKNVQQILLKALAKNPDDRFQTMTEFANKLENCYSGSKSIIRSNRLTDQSIRVSESDQTIDRFEFKYQGNGDDKQKIWKKFAKYIIAGISIVCILILFINYQWIINLYTQTISESASQNQVDQSEVSEFTEIVTATNTPSFTLFNHEAVIQSIVGDSQPFTVDYEENFISKTLLGWAIDKNVKLKNKSLVVDGMGVWNGGYRISNTNWKNGGGVILRFKCSSNSEAEIYMQSGVWEKEGLRRWGIYCNSSDDDWIQANNFGEFSKPIEGTYKGSLSYHENQWYTLILIVDQDGEFYGRVWNENEPQKYYSLRQNLPANWRNLQYKFHIDAFSGTIAIADYGEFSFEN